LREGLRAREKFSRAGWSALCDPGEGRIDFNGQRRFGEPPYQIMSSD
jgi:hypothetical protein